MSQSGSKSKTFDRIVQAHLQALKRAEAEVAMALFNSEQTDPSVAEVPRQPHARERESFTKQPTYPIGRGAHTA